MISSSSCLADSTCRTSTGSSVGVHNVVVVADTESLKASADSRREPSPLSPPRLVEERTPCTGSPNSTCSSPGAGVRGRLEDTVDRVKYLKEKEIHHLLEELCGALLEVKPEGTAVVYDFLIAFLEENEAEAEREQLQQELFNNSGSEEEEDDEEEGFPQPRFDEKEGEGEGEDGNDGDDPRAGGTSPDSAGQQQQQEEGRGSATKGKGGERPVPGGSSAAKYLYHYSPPSRHPSHSHSTTGTAGSGTDGVHSKHSESRKPLSGGGEKGGERECPSTAAAGSVIPPSEAVPSRTTTTMKSSLSRKPTAGSTGSAKSPTNSNEGATKGFPGGSANTGTPRGSRRAKEKEKEFEKEKLSVGGKGTGGSKQRSPTTVPPPGPVVSPNRQWWGQREAHSKRAGTSSHPFQYQHRSTSSTGTTTGQLSSIFNSPSASSHGNTLPSGGAGPPMNPVPPIATVEQSEELPPASSSNLPQQQQRKGNRGGVSSSSTASSSTVGGSTGTGTGSPLRSIRVAGGRKIATGANSNPSDSCSFLGTNPAGPTTTTASTGSTPSSHHETPKKNEEAPPTPPDERISSSCGGGEGTVRAGKCTGSSGREGQCAEEDEDEVLVALSRLVPVPLPVPTTRRVDRREDNYQHMYHYQHSLTDEEEMAAMETALAYPHQFNLVYRTLTLMAHSATTGLDLFDAVE